jgi:hypothetical protein
MRFEKCSIPLLTSISQGEQGNLILPIVCKGIALSFLKGALFDIMESYTDFARDADAHTDNGGCDAILAKIH